MESDANLILSAETLRLESDLVRGQKVRGVFALKRVPSQTYLVVNELQARILEEFTQPKNVPQVLENCIRARMCTALREYYDLVLKAHRAGVLRSEELYREGPAAATSPAVRWFFPLPAWPILIAAALAGVATLFALALRSPVFPTREVDWLIGWLATGAAWSLGHLLAASVLRHGGGEVHAPRFRWLALAPHFATDLSDGCMIGGRARAAMHCAQLFPLALTTAIGLWLRAPWSLLPLAALLIACRPIGKSPVAKLLLLLRRRPLLDTDTPSLFDAPVGLADKWRTAWKRFDLRVATLQFGTGLFWAFAIGHVSYRLRDMEVWPLLHDWTSWEKPLLGIGLTLAVLACMWLAAEIQHHLIDGAVEAWKRIRVARRRWMARSPENIGELEIEALVRRNPLLRRLDPDAQLELVAQLRPQCFGPWRTVVRFDEPAAFVGLILSGRATVYRRHKSGRKARFLQVIEGDLFGAHQLVDPRHAGVEVRTTTPLVAFTLSADDFKRLVIDKLGIPAVSRYVDKHLFLQRSSALCADWRPAAVARLAEIAETASHPAGGKIIQQGEEVGSLYVLCEGRARALQGRKPVGRIRPGDFFGEISLLQTSAATADVETNDDSRCLTVNRVEFIRFMSRNHHVALQMERLCSKRLGRPIFPLDGSSFDER